MWITQKTLIKQLNMSHTGTYVAFFYNREDMKERDGDTDSESKS